MVALGTQPVGVALSVADDQDWSGVTTEELSALLANGEMQQKLARADADCAAGRFVSHGEVGRMLEGRNEIGG